MSHKVCALVGAGPGLGMALARRFGQEGYQMALIARKPEAIADYTQTLKHEGIQAQGFAANAGAAESLVQAFTQIQAELGTPDVLIYNAAVLRQSSLLNTTAEELVQDFQANVVGAVMAVQQVVEGMRQHKQGTILFTGGGLALEPSPQAASLAIGKAAIRNLCFSLAQELRTDGIHVATVTICGYIQPGTRFDPDQIAREYWNLHVQEPSTWDREYVYQ